MRTVGGVYGASLAVLAAAVLLRWSLQPLMGDTLPLVTLYGAVAIAVWIGGYRPAAVTALVGFAVCAYLFADPEGRAIPGGVVGMLIYLLTCTVIIGLGESMRSVRQQLQIVTDGMSALVTRCSADLRYLWVSQAYASWIGRPAAEVTGRRIVDVIGEEAFRQLLPHFRRVLDGHRVKYEEEVEFHGLGRRWINAVYTPTTDSAGEVDGWIAMVTDIHDRKSFEERLRKKNERLGLLSETAALMMLDVEPDVMLRRLFARIGPQLGLDVYFNYMVDDNGAALSLASCAGLPADAIDGLRRLDFGQAICGTVAALRQPIVATFIQQSEDPKAQLVKSLGIRAYACNPLLSGDHLIGTLSFASRVRNEFDATDIEFLQTVSHHVAAAYDRARYVQELREGDRRKDEFLATLAHELRNPLAPLRNVLELMKRMGREGEELVTCRETMERQVDHLVRLVDDLLDISRITRNKLELRLRRVDLASVLRDAIETSGQFHRVDLRLPDVPVWLQADPVRLAQVFGNLLNNAAKFSEPSSRIDVAVLREADGVTVRVRDEGIGIPADQLDSVFDMFSQVDRRLERTQGGLGIGLALVKRLIDLHEGTVSAASDGEGRGSEFVVRLPVAVGAPERAAPRTATPLPNGACRVLVVDDNRDSASSLAMLLTMTGHETHVAYDGVEAVDLAGQVLPGVILLDIGLPKLNGYDACRRIREQAWGKDIVMVAFSGWGQDEDLRRSKEAGFDAHLVKPVDYAALTRVIASHAPKGTA